jgi:hypothetical protein
MKRVILRHHGTEADWSCWRIVWLIKEYKNTWHIWSFLNPLGRFVHKEALGERIEDL